MSALLMVLVVTENRYIAKTLYGEEEEGDTEQANSKIEEPKLLGCHPGTNEKVSFRSWHLLYALFDCRKFSFVWLLMNN